ncbi:MAG: efflux transporter outer membrane subunit [Pseudomonadota bacterium]
MTTYPTTTDCGATAVVRTHRRAAWIAGVVIAAGCASTSAPEFERPDVPTKTNWSADLGEEWSLELDWWRRFGDPYLEQLIATAIERNAELSVIAARSGVARAYVRRAEASLLPTVAAGARQSSVATDGTPKVDVSEYGIGSELSWEIDVWGKARRGVEAQEAAYQSSLADWRAAHLALVGDVATAYLQLRLIDEQVDRQQQAIQRGEEILSIYNDMHAEGLIAQTDPLRQESELNALRAGLIDLERSRQLAVNGLSTLVGEPAGNIVIPDTTEFFDISPVDVPAGLPSEILSRRPDLVAAEYRLLQAVNLNAQARLAQLPSIGLTSVGGTAAYNPTELFRTLTGTIGSFVRFPVFDPNVRARIRVSDAQIEVAETEYRAAVFRAFEEVENALTNVSKRKERNAELLKRIDNLAEAQQQLSDRTRLGLASYLDLLEGQRSLLNAQQDFLLNRWQTLIDTVTLFKAVGGGWPPEQVGAQTIG